MTRIWYIHGANSSPTSFAWLKNQMPEHDAVDISYDHRSPVSQIVDGLVERAISETQPVVVIGHSLGGMIAISLSQRAPLKVKKAVTISSPFLGVRIASFLRWFVPTNLFHDIHPESPFVLGLRKPIQVPVLSLVSTSGGSLLISEPNDGVVTISSQTGLRGPRYLPISANHFEILLANDTVDHVKNFVF